MTTFWRCKNCNKVIEKRAPPIRCAGCQKTGTYAEASDATQSSAELDTEEEAKREGEQRERERVELEIQRRAQEERDRQQHRRERSEEERLEKDRQEQQRLERERLAQDRLQQERLEKERLEQERLEQERLEQERLEQERLEQERLEQERLEQERLEQERLEQERLERELRESRPQNLLWQHQPAVSSTKHPLRGCPAVDSQGRAFVAVGSDLVMFSSGHCDPKWKYATAGPILGSPVLGPDGNIRVHSTDGYLHLVGPDGARVSAPADVGPPLGWASPMVDSDNRTWIAQSTGGIISIDADGELARRRFYRTRRRFDCTGVIRDGLLYIGGEDHFVHAINLTGERGENVWKDSPDAGRTGGSINCPLVVSGSELLVISQDGLLHAFDWNGLSRWSVPIAGQVFGSPVVDPEGTILVGVSQTPRHQPMAGLIVAIDGATHKTRWEFKVDAPIESTPVIGDDGIIYFGDNNGTLYALRSPHDVIWKASFDAQIRSGGTFLSPNVVAFGLDDGSLVALKCSSGGLASKGWPKLQRTFGQSGILDV